MSKRDYTIKNLLILNGDIFEIGGGFWVKFEAKKLNKFDQSKPFGIKYSLTLHSPDGERILGYDNAHSITKSKKNLPHDHKHKGGRMIRYEYESAAKLLKDFWADVDKILIARGVI